MTRGQEALRVVRLLALVVWVGGLIFFAFVVAPVAFSRLPTTHEAGLVVGACLRVLHWIGLAAGAVYLLASAGRAQAGRRRVGPILVGCMMGVTAASQWLVLPAMERDRVAAGGEIRGAGIAATDFERLHRLSEKMEGGVLLLGLVVVGLAGLGDSVPGRTKLTGPTG